MSTMSLHNREVAVANAICHDRNVKRAYEIHNAKINAVHSTSTLSTTGAGRPWAPPRGRAD